MLSAAKIVQGKRNFRASECNQVYLNCRAQPKIWNSFREKVEICLDFARTFH